MLLIWNVANRRAIYRALDFHRCYAPAQLCHGHEGEPLNHTLYDD